MIDVKYDRARRFCRVMVSKPDVCDKFFSEMDATPDQKCAHIAMAYSDPRVGFGSQQYAAGFMFALCLLHPGDTPINDECIETFIANQTKKHADKTINFSAYLAERKKQ